MSNPCEAECSDCFEHLVLNGLLFSFFVLCDVTERISEQLHLLDVQTFCLRGAALLRKSGLKGEELNRGVYFSQRTNSEVKPRCRL